MGQHFQFLALFAFSEPPLTPKVHFFGLVLHGSEVPVAAGSAGLAFPEFFQHPGGIQTPSFGDSGQGRSQRGGDEVPNPFPTTRQHSLGFHHPLQNQKSRIFASQMIWERAGTARSGSGAPAPRSPRVSRAPRGGPGVFFPESTLKSRPGGGCASLGSGAFGRGARPRLKLRC